MDNWSLYFQTHTHISKTEFVTSFLDLNMSDFDLYILKKYIFIPLLVLCIPIQWGPALQCACKIGIPYTKKYTCVRPYRIFTYLKSLYNSWTLTLESPFEWFCTCRKPRRNHRTFDSSLFFSFLLTPIQIPVFHSYSLKNLCSQHYCTAVLRHRKMSIFKRLNIFWRIWHLRRIFKTSFHQGLAKESTFRD